jgi:glutathione peroxidase
MKKYKIIFLFLMTAISLSGFSQTSDFYSFKVKTLDGGIFDFATLKGKKVLIVNTASKCGFTPQYKDLEALYTKMGGENFVIIGFPANNFANQEPGTAAEIKEFCTKNFGVTFPMMDKISVKGSDMSPVYLWLTSKSKNGVMDSEVKWNFQKYLVDEKGNLKDVAYSKESPLSERIIAWIAAK